MVPWTRGDPHLLCLCVQDLWRLPHGADGCERRAGFRGLFAQGHQFAVERALHPRAHAGAGNHFQADPVLQARRPAPVRCLWAAARAAGVTGAGGRRMSASPFDSMFDKSEHPIVIEAPKEVLQIRLQHPANPPAGDDLSKGPQSMVGAELWSAAERAGQKVLLVNSGQHLSRGALERPVADSWYPERPLLRLARLRDIDPPNVGRAISLAVDGLEHRLYPALEALLRRLHRLTIHPGGGSLRNL